MADVIERGDVDPHAFHEIRDEDYPDRVNNPQDYKSLLDRQNEAVIPTYVTPNGTSSNKKQY